MVDLVSVFDNHCTNLGWVFSYGNKANQNLLKSNKISNEITLLLDPLTRVKNKNEYGGVESVEFSGDFLLLVKSNFDKSYTKKYTEYIQPLITSLELLETKIDCSEYEIIGWTFIDTINELDTNLDGLIVSYKIKKV